MALESYNYKRMAQVLKLLKANTNEILANFIPDGSVDLYHDASKKFETTSTGATVTGDLVELMV